MKHAVIVLLLSIAPACGQSLLGVDSANDRQGVAVEPAALATQALDAATARTAFDAFLKVFFISDQGICRKVEVEPAPRPQPHNPWEWIGDKLDRARDWVVEESRESIRLHKADYWWVPHFIEMAADSYELTGEARDRDFAKTMNDALFSPYYYWWFNSFNDDLAWHMLSCLRMHDVTNDPQWLEDGKKLYHRIREYKDGEYGGGVWWKRDGTRFKNVPVNAPFVIGACKLFQKTGDPLYKTDALEVYAWTEENLTKPDGTVLDGRNDSGIVPNGYTYNAGTWVGASLGLYELTRDTRYLTNATKAADWALATMAPNGIVKDEGAGDGAGFKMILTRYLVDLATRPGGEKYAEFLDKNAASAWANRRQKDQIMGYNWAQPAAGTGIQSFTAAAGVDIILQSRLVHKRLGR